MLKLVRSRLLLAQLLAILVQRLVIPVQRLATPVRLLATPVQRRAILALQLAIPAILALVRATPAPPTKYFLGVPLPLCAVAGLSKTVCGPEAFCEYETLPGQHPKVSWVALCDRFRPKCVMKQTKFQVKYRNPEFDRAPLRRAGLRKS